VKREDDFPVSEFPLPTLVEPLGDHVARSQLAERRDYLKEAIRDLKAAGVPESAIHSFLEALRDLKAAGVSESALHSLNDKIAGFRNYWKPSVAPEESYRLLGNLFVAWRLSMSRPGTLDIDEPELSQSEREITTARQKLALQEITTKYAKMDYRWEGLAPLPFVDPQFAEATRCFLYGFCRAAIVLSASALEDRLKRITGIVRAGSYAELVEAAQHKAGFGEDIKGHAEQVFRKRNDVVHESWKPDRDSASGVLVQARMVLLALPPD
jgi:hypothetical protein